MTEEQKVSVMELERFAIHDGPGIRTLVFLQGCPLRCRWCANPESQVPGIHLMYDRNRCAGCGQCAGDCPVSAITFENDSPRFDREACIRCRQCAKNCRQNAIRFSGRSMTVDEIVEEVLKDKDYYDNSGGGITCSGGEPFAQFTVLLQLLKRCREHGLHTAVETCGQTSLEKIKEAEPLVDLFLYDLKHVEPEKFKEYTGGDIRQILQNLEYLAGVKGDKVILRVPVIPGFNHESGILCGIFSKACEYGIKTVHLLPYHTLGIGKYEQLGRNYTLPWKTLMAKEELNQYKAMGEEAGLIVKIGG